MQRWVEVEPIEFLEEAEILLKGEKLSEEDVEVLFEDVRIEPVVEDRAVGSAVIPEIRAEVKSVTYTDAGTIVRVEFYEEV
ncbi:MAG: hypothetical protein GXO39_04390 [Thermotogae bacterium]|nr:hypothetical protein [Thermotogota bacterium]